jgi:hypothetical protein
MGVPVMSSLPLGMGGTSTGYGGGAVLGAGTVRGAGTVLGAGTVIIDLGMDRGEPASYRDPGRSTTPGWFPAALLAAIVLFCATASAAPEREPLSPVFRLEIGPADAYALSDHELLAQTFGQLTSYDLRSGQVRWQAGQSAPVYRLQPANGLLLMRPWTVGQGDPGTTAISVANGVRQWQHAGTVVSMTGSTTLLAVESMRSYAGINRRVEGPIEALDPATGRTRWTVQVPTSGVLLGVPGPADTGARMLIVNAEQTMALYDLDTGRKVARAKVPDADFGPDNPSVTGGVIMIKYPGVTGPEIAAYNPLTLRMLWAMPAYDTTVIKECGRLACLIGRDGVHAIDPPTGDQRWYTEQWKDLDVYGSMYVAYAAPGTHQSSAIIDPETGEAKVDLTGWRPVGGAGGGDHLLVTRAGAAGARTMVAVARLNQSRPRLLADLPAGTGDCQAVPSRIVCRSTYGELVVWAYRER